MGEMSSKHLSVPQSSSPLHRPVTRVLVTGATGLLGRQVMQLFSSTNWEAGRRLELGALVQCLKQQFLFDLQVCGLCKSRAQAPRILSCDLIQEDAFWHIMQGFQPQACVLWDGIQTGKLRVLKPIPQG